MTKELNQKIRTLNKYTQVMRNCHAFFDMECGTTELGCDETHTVAAIWHETIHQILFEQFYLEACFMFDNIADDLHCFLFDMCVQDRPYVYMVPAIRAKSIDGGAWVSGKKKQTEKSVIIGYKRDPKYQRKVPVRHPSNE